jgi:hypothetical protein
MTRAFVLGNGVSRNQVDLSVLRTLGPVYGCNALYRDFEPDVLVSTDSPISQRIQQEGYSATHVHYTRRPLPDSGAIRIPQQYFGFSSGPVAVGLAALDRHRSIYLVGFDMGPTRTGKFNNMYADTEFYKKSHHPSTFSGNWVRQLLTIAKDFPKCDFFRVKGDTTAEITELQGAKNLAHMTMVEFQNRINNKTDA